MGAQPQVLILHATGTNRDREAARACELAGAKPDIRLLSDLTDGTIRLADYQMLLLPGGFSFGDDLGAGKLWALRLHSRIGDQLRTFVDDGWPVLGICNGFQALVKAGLLPGALPVEGAHVSDALFGPAHATLTRNISARFECRWVHLQPNPASPSVFVQGLGEELIYCPVAHGEGRFVARDERTLSAIEDANLVALRYVTATGGTPTYPADPNGSDHPIAGVCNAAGNVMGLMPHPEDHITARQHPGYHRGQRGGLGLRLFEAGVRYAAQR